MTAYPQVKALIDKWITGRDITMRDLINLTPAQREEFFCWLTPANEANVRRQFDEYTAS